MDYKEEYRKNKIKKLAVAVEKVYNIKESWEDVGKFVMDLIEKELVDYLLNCAEEVDRSYFVNECRNITIENEP